MSPWQWVFGGKRRVLRGPLVDENGSRNGSLGPYGEDYTGISIKYETATGRVLEVRYPDGTRLTRNPLRVLLNRDFKNQSGRFRARRQENLPR